MYGVVVYAIVVVGGGDHGVGNIIVDVWCSVNAIVVGGGNISCRCMLFLIMLLLLVVIMVVVMLLLMYGVVDAIELVVLVWW